MEEESSSVVILKSNSDIFRAFCMYISGLYRNYFAVRVTSPNFDIYLSIYRDSIHFELVSPGEEPRTHVAYTAHEDVFSVHGSQYPKYRKHQFPFEFHTPIVAFYEFRDYMHPGMFSNDKTQMLDLFPVVFGTDQTVVYGNTAFGIPHMQGRSSGVFDVDNAYQPCNSLVEWWTQVDRTQENKDKYDNAMEEYKMTTRYDSNLRYKSLINYEPDMDKSVQILSITPVYHDVPQEIVHKKANIDNIGTTRWEKTRYVWPLVYFDFMGVYTPQFFSVEGKPYAFVYTKRYNKFNNTGVRPGVRNLRIPLLSLIDLEPVQKNVWDIIDGLSFSADCGKDIEVCDDDLPMATDDVSEAFEFDLRDHSRDELKKSLKLCQEGEVEVSVSGGGDAFDNYDGVFDMQCAKKFIDAGCTVLVKVAALDKKDPIVSSFVGYVAASNVGQYDVYNFCADSPIMSRAVLIPNTRSHYVVVKRDVASSVNEFIAPGSNVRPIYQTYEQNKIFREKIGISVSAYGLNMFSSCSERAKDNVAAMKSHAGGSNKIFLSYLSLDLLKDYVRLNPRRFFCHEGLAVVDLGRLVVGLSEDVYNDDDFDDWGAALYVFDKTTSVKMKWYVVTDSMAKDVLPKGKMSLCSPEFMKKICYPPINDDYHDGLFEVVNQFVIEFFA